MLNDKQERFCREYVIDLNGKQAAIRAGYSEVTAEVQASRLLSIVKVQERVKQLQDEIGKRLDLTADMVVMELAKIGFSNMSDYVNGDLTFKKLDDLTTDKTAAISSIEVSEFRGGKDSRATEKKIKFRLHDKRAALVDLGKHLGIFEKDNSQKVPPITLNFTPVASKDK